MSGVDCAHSDRVDGQCTACGHCVHEVILNGACMACGTTEFPQRVEDSWTKAGNLVPVSRLVRGDED